MEVEMKKTYTTPAMVETLMDMQIVLTEMTGVQGSDGTGWGGVDDGGLLDPEANSRDGWESFWESRE